MAASRDGNRQVVVVTGASGGIGRAVAEAFGARGDRVAVLARGQAGLDAACREITQRAARPMRSASTSPIRTPSTRPRRRWRPDGDRSTCGSTSRSPRCSPRSTRSAPAEFKRVTEVSYLGYVYGTMAALSPDEAA